MCYDHLTELRLRGTATKGKPMKKHFPLILAAALMTLLLSSSVHASLVAFTSNVRENTISLINVSDGSVLETIAVGRGPQGVALSPDGRYLYVANQLDDTISVLSVPDTRFIKNIPAQGGPVAIAVSPDGGIIFVSCYSSGLVTVLRADDGAVISTIPVGEGAAGLSLSSDGKHLYAANRTEGTIAIIQTSDYTVAMVIDLGAAFGPSGVRISPGGDSLYVTGYWSNGVAVIDRGDHRIRRMIETGKGPSGIAFTPDGRYAYVKNEHDGTLSVIDVSENRLIDTVSFARPPKHSAAMVAIPQDGTAVTGIGLDFVVAIKAPALLYANTASLSQINLSWTDTSTDEVGFRIERRTADGTFLEITTVGADTTFYSDTGLLPYTTYYYRVRAYNLSENSPYSNQASATTSGKNYDDDDSHWYCYFGTVISGTPAERHLNTLRGFRDKYLLTNSPGRMFVKVYYRISPSLVELSRQSEFARLIGRMIVIPVIYAVIHPETFLIFPVLLLSIYLFRRIRISALKQDQPAAGTLRLRSQR
jgi:YVTN family beta-propeller protein